jgi:pyrroline-5-carboxylate reductase
MPTTNVLMSCLLQAAAELGLDEDEAAVLAQELLADEADVAAEPLSSLPSTTSI